MRKLRRAKKAPVGSLVGLGLVVLCCASVASRTLVETAAANLGRVRRHQDSSNLTVKHNSNLQLASATDGKPKIPGLYDHVDEVLMPIQGINQFYDIVLGGRLKPETKPSNCSLKQAAGSQVLSLVQFYMATCPDCQGFSGYFKRFAADVGPAWKRLVQIFVVNCNDHQNLYLCQEQNPKILVPMVRWYKLPLIQHDTLVAQQASRSIDSPQPKSGATAESSNSTSTCGLDFRHDQLSVAHRQFIDEERRDHIALRRATLKYIGMMLDELAGEELSSSSVLTLARRRLLLDALPAHWHQLQQLDRSHSGGKSLVAELNVRHARCLRDAGANNTRTQVENFIILEPRTSYIGRTVIADWSRVTCQSDPSKPLFMIHRSSDASLSKFYPTLLNLGDHQVLHFNASTEHEIREHPPVTPTGARERRVQRHALQSSGNRLQRIQQRASLERFYSSLGTQSTGHHGQPVRYVAAMNGQANLNGHSAHKREVAADKQKRLTFDTKLRAKGEVNYNWKNETAYPREEEMRWTINKLIGKHLNLTHVPGSLLKGTHPGEIQKVSNVMDVKVVAPKEDDLTLMFLTDYYKGLDSLVHNDMLAKSELDGLQLLGNCCFLRKIALYFPWQGNAHGSLQIGKRSIARHYIEMLSAAWFSELKQALRNVTNDIEKTSHPARRFFDLNLEEACESLPDSRDVASAFAALKGDLERARISTQKLEASQRRLSKELQIGLPPEKKLKWNYCAGSKPYLRSHTCSLWIIFHTLTVHEYLNLQNMAEGESLSRPTTASAAANSSDTQYEFQVDYSKPPLIECDPKNPDNGLINTPTSRLFANATSHVLADIINYVRFNLPCTNCAAHFSCMVSHSPGLHIDQLAPPDAHLLWLWEGHNRVNMRTRNTHSEDPTRPKHVFPSYEACPQCYLERPRSAFEFTKMRFNRQELVNFLVLRYRKSAILNNKLNIEALFAR